MKKIIPAIALMLLATSANAFASTNTEVSSVASFAGGNVNSVVNGTYTVENVKVQEEFFVEGEREVGYVYGKFGKNADDASLAFKFNNLEFEYTATSTKNPTWAHCTARNNLDTPQQIELGQKIHYSLLETNENAKVSMRLYLYGTGSSGKSLGTYHYTHIEPGNTKDQWDGISNYLMMRYGRYAYIASTESGINGLWFASNQWHRYDIVVDTQDEAQGGVQTIKMYYDGKMYSYAVLDCDKDTDGVQYIQQISGVGIQMLPTVSKVNGTENRYTCVSDTEYIDDISISVLDEDEEPELLVSGKKYSGSYRVGDTAKFFAPFTKELPMVPAAYGTGRDAEYNVFYPDDEGNISADLGDGEKETRLFLWEQNTLTPLTVPYTFVPYNPIKSADIDFDNNSDGVRAEIGNAVPSSASGVMSGALGKSEKFFYASNGTGAVSSDDVSRLETAVTADINTEYKKDEALWLSFEYAHKSNAYSKSIYINPQNALARELLTISEDGTVSIGRIECDKVKLLPNQWYRFDIVLNSNLRGTYNTVTIYINGIKCAEDFPIYLGETSLKDGRVIDSVKIAYNLSSSNTAAEDGIYLDNVKAQICDRFLPDITEYNVKSSDTIYNMITDSTSFTIDQYGQKTDSFIETLKAIDSAVFVTSNGTETTTLPNAGEGYLRVTANGGYDVYYSLTEGTDDKIRESIDPVENDYNPDTEDWYAYEAPDINVVMQDGNILNVASENPVKAGSLGTMSTSGENFMAGDTPVKFWGCNLLMEACIPTHEQADKMADMIASYGFNIVRIHKLTDPRTQVFGESGYGQILDDEMMDRFCYLVNKLNERGIYIYLDLGRKICDEDVSDGLIERNPTSDSIFWFDDKYQQIQIDFAKQLLTYKDPYTNKRLCDNDSIMGVQCVNEAYIYYDKFENALGFDSEEYQYYYAKMNEKFDAWYREKHTDYKTAYSSIGLSYDEANGSTITIGSNEQRGISGKGSAPWTNEARQENLIRFFNEMQAAYFAKMQTMLDENNINIPMTGSTVWHNSDVALMDANLDTAFIDTHAYWGHPLNSYSLGTGTQYTDVEMLSMLKSPKLGIIGYIMNRKPYNKPYTISEWNECPENQYMSEGPLLMAAYSKYQNWNSMIYMFTGDQLTNYKNEYMYNAFQMTDNPIMLSTMQAATLLWRNVSEAGKSNYIDYSDTKSYEFSKHKPEVYNSTTGLWQQAERQWWSYDPITTNPTVGMLAKTGISIREQPQNDDVLSEKTEALASGVYTSDTGELTFDSNNETFTVNTSKSKAATGFFKGETLIGDALKFSFDNEFATVYVNSVTDSDISSSDRLLLTVAGRAVNTDQVLQRSGSPYVIRCGKAPVLMEQITGTVKIKTNSAMKVYALTSSGERKKQIPTSYSNGWLTIPLSLSDECVNYEIVTAKVAYVDALQNNTDIKDKVQVTISQMNKISKFEF